MCVIKVTDKYIVKITDKQKGTVLYFIQFNFGVFHGSEDKREATRVDKRAAEKIANNIAIMYKNPAIRIEIKEDDAFEYNN